MALTKAKLIELIDNGDIDVGGGGVNPNILHNWDFRNPVNQRGLETASGGGYWLDRWTVNTTSGVSYTHSSAWGLQIMSSVDYVTMSQYIENPNAYAGKTVTVSVEIHSATVPTASSVRLYCNGTTTQIGILSIITGNTGIKSFTAVIPDTALTDLSVRFHNYAESVVRVKRIKLELGTVSTLAYDPPMDHASELLKCQRFFFALNDTPIAIAGYTGATAVLGYVSVPAPVAMRVTPTHSGGTPTFRINGSNYATTIAIIACNNNIIRLNLSATGLPSVDTANAYLASCEFSADL